MNNLFQLNSLNALRSLRHVSHSQSAGLRRLTTCSSLIRKHSIASSPHNLLIARNFRSDSRNNEITPPFNWGIRIVPESIVLVIERFGKYHTTLHSGIHFLIPFIDKIAFAYSLKDEIFNVPNQTAVTQDNATIQVNSVIYLKIMDPFLASYRHASPFDASIHLAQGIMRTAIAKLSLDNAFKEREDLNNLIVKEVNEAAKVYGLECIQYVITDITFSEKVKNSMEMQADAERKKRVTVLASEGELEAAINKAEGEKRAAFLAAEGDLAKADAASKGISLIAKSLMEPGGMEAAGLKVAEQYVFAFGNLAKEGTSTVFLPNDASSVSSMISQAITLYKRLGGNPSSDKKLNVGSTGGFKADAPSEESQDGIKADTPSEESQDGINLIDEDKESVFSLQNRNATDDPGFSLQNRNAIDDPGFSLQNRHKEK